MNTMCTAQKYGGHFLITLCHDSAEILPQLMQISKLDSWTQYKVNIQFIVYIMAILYIFFISDGVCFVLD